jgi:GntR family transcriptional repressor for pyruvate dehydrogenase complex
MTPGLDQTDTFRRRIRHVRVADTVAADLRSRILSGGFSSEALPTQTEIAAEWGVGLTSVREALRVLESEGLITIRRGNQGGATVHSPDVDSASFSLGLSLQASATTIDELGVALSYVEPLCAALCAESADRESIAGSLDRLNDEAMDAVDDELAFTRLSREFHSQVVARCGNRAISLVVESMVGLWTFQEEAWARELTQDDSYPERERRIQVVEAHRVIARGIADGDRAAAEHASRSHLHAAQRYILASGGNKAIDVTRGSLTATRAGR